MLNRGWRPGLAVLAAFGMILLAALPGQASAAVRQDRQESGEFAGSAAADGIRDNQQWVLSMLNAEAAWSAVSYTHLTLPTIYSV